MIEEKYKKYSTERTDRAKQVQQEENGRSGDRVRVNDRS